MILSKDELQSWRKGKWFRSTQLNQAIVKIKSARGPWGDRVVALWLHSDDPERISIIVYQVNPVDEERFRLDWHDGYCFGRVCEDEDDILDESGLLDPKRMIATIDDSLENMEYGLVTRKELNETWEHYTKQDHQDWEISPLREERVNR